MKRLLIPLLAVASSHAMAQEDRMEHVLVSVPIHKKSAETALPVTILNGRELQRAVAGSIGETLGDKPGISSSSFGPGVGRPVVRGQQGPRAITLQNGTSVADVSSLSPDHAVGVDPMLAESIEVLRGPSTLLYGGGAIGGVVNVIDNRIPLQPLGELQGAIEYRYNDAAESDTGVAKLEGGNESFSFHLSGTFREFNDLDIPGLAIDEAALESLEEHHDEDEHDDDHKEHDNEHDEHEEELENTDGFIANTDGDFDSYTVGGSFHFGEKGFFGLAVNRMETEYGIPPGSHGHHEEEHGEEDHDDEHHDEDEHHGEDEHHDEGEHEDEHHEDEEEIIRIDLEQTRYDAMLHLHGLVPGFVDVMRGFLTYTDYAHVELEGVEVGTRFDRETWEGRLELVHDGSLHGVVGLQWKADEFEAVGEEAYVPATDSTEIGIFVVEDFHSGDWRYELGGRLDRVERDPAAQRASQEDFSSFSVSGAAIWDFQSNWSAGLSLSRSARAPSTEELFSNVDATDHEEYVTHAATGAIEIGDPNLDEEASINVDLNLSWENGGDWILLSLFYNSFEDYIFLVNTGEEVDETAVYAYHQEDADFYGIEFESHFGLGEMAGGDLTLGVFGDYINAEFDSSGDVPRMPPARIGSELEWSNGALDAWIKVLNASDQDNAGEFESDTDGYTRWDAGIDYSWTLGDDTQLLAFLKWKNIGDEEIRLSTSFLRNYAPQSGESVEAGIRYSF